MAIAKGGDALGLSGEQLVACLGMGTHDTYLNDVAFWRNVPENVWGCDLTFLVAYLFGGGGAPDCIEEADVNGDGNGPNIQDLTHLVAYLFGGGPAPAPCP